LISWSRPDMVPQPRKAAAKATQKALQMRRLDLI
jgi:hypothetical protein